MVEVAPKRVYSMPILRLLKKVLRSIAPHGVVANHDRRRAERSIWQGVYDNFADVPSAGRGFESDGCTHAMRERLAIDTAAMRGKGAVSREKEYQGDHGGLIIAAALLPSDTQRLRIVDFGGSVGLAYPLFRASLPPATEVEYDVVELPRMCAEGRRLFAADSHISFYEDIRDVEPGPDIVYANGVLQSIREYEAALEGLLALKSRIMLLCDLPGGDGPRFATAQKNISGSVPTWFFNIPSVENFIEARGYSVRAHIRTDIGYAQDGFPLPHRTPWVHTLLFTRAR